MQISVYFLNIVSTYIEHENENKQTAKDAFDLQEMKKWDSLFMFWQFLFFNLSS